jgi:hypothetical protein
MLSVSGKNHRTHCTCCGGHKSVVGEISWGGNCRPCGLILQAEQIHGNATKSGPGWRRMLRGYARMLERAAAQLDEAQAQE